ncbi:MAG TPA: hypothetical protein VMT82_06480 [candidate division Zixibacteria bacterium]|nr:hypothetical protein [candidate division Zixibacteria bacterium]
MSIPATDHIPTPLRRLTPLLFTVIGKGGESAALPGISDESFWWADTTGGVTGEEFTASTNFNPVQNDKTDPTKDVTGFPTKDFTGSYLLSSRFTLSAGEKLKVVATSLTAHSSPFTDIGFALLMKNSQVAAVLSNTRPDGIKYIRDFGPLLGSVLVAPGPGVAVNEIKPKLSQIVVIGGAEYGRHDDPGYCQASDSCLIQTTSVCTPGPGTYQLIFGAFNVRNNGLNGTRPTIIIVNSVTE